jgi:hypothetical protein
MKNAQGADRTSPFTSASENRNTILQPVLQRKYFQKEGFREYVWMDIRWETDKLSKPTRAVKRVLQLTDLFGDPQLTIDITLDEPLHPGKPYLQAGIGFTYNEFMDSHHWVLAAEVDDMRLVFVPKAVIYADGTQQRF